MELRHIDIANLTVSTANKRGKSRPDIASILPSFSAHGVLAPLIVRASRSAAPSPDPDSQSVGSDEPAGEVVAAAQPPAEAA